MTNMLIALHGPQGAGKDATAEILVREHGFTRLAFADRLKEVCEAANPIVTYRVDRQLITELCHYEGLDFQEVSLPTLRPVRLLEVVEQLGWDEAKRRHPEVRRTQQYLATEVVRDMIDGDYWVNYVYRQIREGGRYVITDLRFPNEYAMIRRKIGEPSWWEQGVVWWVQRPNNPYEQRKAHRSEDWHPPQYRKIDNSGDLDGLAKTVAENLRFWKTQIPHEKYEAGLV